MPASQTALGLATARPNHEKWCQFPSSPTTKLTELDVPPPGGGLNTVTRAIPAMATSVAGIAALNCVAETYVVARSCPFHRTTEPVTKFVPVTVSVNPGPTATACVGR